MTKEEIAASLPRYRTRIARVIPRLSLGEQIPVPEVATRYPGKWTVQQANGIEGNVTPLTRTMTVPFGPSALARHIRLEELLHSRHSTAPVTETAASKVWAVASQQLIQSAEDYRVRRIASYKFAYDLQFRKGSHQHAQIMGRQLLEMAPNGLAILKGRCPYPIEWIAACYTSCWYEDKGVIIGKFVDRYLALYELSIEHIEHMAQFKLGLMSALMFPSAASYLHKFTPKRYNPFTVRLATALTTIVKEYEEKLRIPAAPPPAPSNMAHSEAPKVPVLPPKAFQSDISAEEARFYKASGRLDIITPPLHRRLLFSLKSKSVSSTGVLLHRIENIAIDPLNPPIFAIRDTSRAKAPVVLLDASGSMGIRYQNVKELIHLAPGCIVAFYSGAGDHGKLVLVSKAGRYCEPAQFKDHMYGGNSVDFLAIKWCLDTFGGHRIHYVTDQGYSWPNPPSSWVTIDSDLTKYCQKRGVIFHPDITRFGRYLKAQRR